MLEYIAGKEGWTIEYVPGDWADLLDQLVIMDIQLPDIDGLEVTERIRASEADSEIPIIALTSYAMAGDRDKVLAAGCTGYIEKPINPGPSWRR